MRESQRAGESEGKWVGHDCDSLAVRTKKKG